MSKIKTEAEIKILKEGGKKLAMVLRTVGKEVKPGVSTWFLNEKAKSLIDKAGGKAAFLNYTPEGALRPYPASICISINDEIVHGIPNENPKILKDGDIVTLDCGISYKGLFTDSAITVIAGKGDKEKDKNAEKLIRATEEALIAAIKVAVPGNRINDIGAAIEKVARKRGFSPAKDLGGHSVGHAIHEEPYIPNYKVSGKSALIEEGMVLAIEPMLVEGKGDIKLMPDGYTYSTKDGGRAAHAEHTVVIRKSRPEILTL
ncbi:MAG: type I methionyl aminopeptidase [Candidatus Paceibacterota bacterium]